MISYPLERMERVIQLLSQRNDLKIFLFGGGKTEKMQLDQWVAKYPQCTNVTGRLDGLKQELLLIRQLDLMLTMDSANMHLASLVATPAVSIWGATHPFAGFMGWNQSADNAVQVDLPCRPCSIYGKKPCHRGDYACLNEIQPETIVKKVVENFVEKVG